MHPRSQATVLHPDKFPALNYTDALGAGITAKRNWKKGGRQRGAVQQYNHAVLPRLLEDLLWGSELEMLSQQPKVHEDPRVAEEEARLIRQALNASIEDLRIKINGDVADPLARALDESRESARDWALCDVCDVSSVASSWLDVGDIDPLTECDGDEAVAAPLTYAALAARAAARPGPGTTGPKLLPLWPQKRAILLKPNDKAEDDDNVELDVLERHRLQPATRRGYKLRHL